MSVPVIWLSGGKRTLDDILDEIESESPRGALRIAVEIRGRAEILLSEHPRIGRAGRLKNTRELVIVRTPYIVLYRIRREAVEIIRVIHGAQRWPPGKRD